LKELSLIIVDTKSALRVLEKAKEAFQDTEVAAHLVYIAEGDLLDALQSCHKFLEKHR
jgi:hypothetical protein